MSTTQRSAPPTFPGGFFVYDSTLKLYYVVVENNNKLFIVTSAPDFDAPAIGNRAFYSTTGDYYNATDTSGTWELMSTQT